ncbi:MAG: orotate phosphoribosyltransferase [Candidatus Aenigmatarchaeota archaeon]
MELTKSKMKLLEAAIPSGTLKFGEFKLKSGRISPYFWNAAAMSDGNSCSLEGIAYATKLTEIGTDKFDVVFGPAYKAIPISVSTAISLKRDYDINKMFAYDRKLPKDHGDPMDRLINGRLDTGDRIMILDDVITTGKTKKDEIKLLDDLNKELEVVGILIGLNRKETDKEGNDPVKVLQDEVGVPVYSILNSVDIFELLHNKEILGNVWVDDEKYNQFQEYKAKYGVN